MAVRICFGYFSEKTLWRHSQQMTTNHAHATMLTTSFSFICTSQLGLEQTFLQHDTTILTCAQKRMSRPA